MLWAGCWEDNCSVGLFTAQLISAVNLPNYITMSRIFSIPLLIWILLTHRISSLHGEKELLASAVFILASITDGLMATWRASAGK